MKVRILDTTPTPHMLRSMASSTISTPEAISELVDNSLDAGATELEISFTGEMLRVSDNGHGCDDLQPMVRLGSHKQQTSTKLGRFGVGLKDSSCALGDMLRIVSVHDGVKRTCELSWPESESHENWQGAKEIEHDPEKLPSGTVIEVSRLRRPIFEKSVRPSIAFNFAPAMWVGKKIALNNVRVVAWTPKFVGEKIIFEDEHPALPIAYRVEAGITDANDRHPFILAYEHRIIGGTAEPCGDYNTSNRFLAVVTLKDLNGDGWHLLRNKTGLRHGLESQWLSESLHSACLPLLKQVHQLGENIELEEIAADIALAIGMAKRPNRTNQTGTILEVGSSRKTRESTSVNGGGDVTQKAGGKHGFSISYSPFSTNRLGRCEVNGKRTCVHLNESHPYIKLARSISKELVKCCALFLICEDQSSSTDPAQTIMAFESVAQREKFSEAISKYFALLATAITAKETPVSA